MLNRQKKTYLKILFLLNTEIRQRTTVKSLCLFMVKTIVLLFKGCNLRIAFIQNPY